MAEKAPLEMISSQSEKSSLRYMPIQASVKYKLVRGRLSGELEDERREWLVDERPLSDICDLDVEAGEVVVAFLPNEEKHIIDKELQKEMSLHFQIPQTFWTKLTQEASGFVGCEQEGEGESVAFRTISRFLIKESVEKKSTPDTESEASITPIKRQANGSHLSEVVPAPKEGQRLDTDYDWHRLGFFTSWKANRSLLVLAFDLPSSFEEGIIAGLRDKNAFSTLDPFSFEASIMEQIVQLYDRSLWSWRHVVRLEVEKKRPDFTNPKPDYIGLHNLQRHVIHCSEMLNIGLETIASLIHEHRLFFEENKGLHPRSMTECRRNNKQFRYCKSLMKCLHLRSVALEERLRNESNLIFHAVNQYDSQLTKIDSAAMKTVSVLGLIFLPANFICAIFSTTFFSFTPAEDGESEHWTMSNMFWLYWVVTIPLTVAIWFFWSHWQKTYTNSAVMQKK